MMDIHSLELLDQKLTLAINSLHSAFTDPVMQFFSNKVVWIPMYAAILAIIFWKLGWKRALVLTGGILLTFLLCDQTANIVKHAAQRIRPVNDPSMLARGLHILERGGGFSFFSAHAANAFGIACCTIPVLWKFASGKRKDAPCSEERKTKVGIFAKIYCAWMVIWAFMVSVSRIFVGKHFLGDVIVGTMVGITFGLAVGYLAIYAIRRIAA